MFRKLLKYEIKAIGKLWWIGAVVSLSAAITAALLFRFFYSVIDLESDSIILNLATVFALCAAIVCIIAVGLSFLFTLILVYVRYYKHFFTDEGYLTFTLPVKRGTLLLSKVVSAAVWYVLHIVVIAISIFVFSLLVVPPEKDGFFLNFAALEMFGDLLRSMWQGVGAWTVVYILEAVFLIFACVMYSMMLIHFCITFGAVLVKRAKILLSIGIYYLMSSLMQTIGQVGFLLFGSLISEGMVILMNDASQNQSCAAFAVLFLGVIAAVSAIASLFYSLTRYLLDRKLNLT